MRDLHIYQKLRGHLKEKTLEELKALKIQILQYAFVKGHN